MSKPSAVAYERGHLWQVAAGMRQADRDETLASSGLCPTMGLMMSVDASTYLRSFVVDGKAFAILGVGARTLFAEHGSPWLLGTDAITEHQNWFLRETRRQVLIMLGRHQFLENWVDARNSTSIKWLEWLGFSLDEPAPFGVAQLPFRRFEMRG